jgi:hypothetical protein
MPLRPALALCLLALLTPQGRPRARADASCPCKLPVCLGLCDFRPERGPLRLGQPNQVDPPLYGWTVPVPPLPPAPRKPGDPPRPPTPWKPLFFDNDFSYVADPESPFRNTFDPLKRRKDLGDLLTYDLGGESRWMGRAEDNRRLTGEQNNFDMIRQRLYLNAQVGERFRTYWEFQYADASAQTVPPVFFDRDHGDVNNAFGEYRLATTDTGAWYARYGWHEELLFGNQRLVSPLDWANVRRTFDLVPHLLYRGQTWTFDAFWSRPNVILVNQLNQPDYGLQFYGAYFSYKGAKDQLYDLYYLALQGDGIRNAQLTNGETGDFNVQTLGLRWQGQRAGWLWEGEAAYQFGSHTVTDTTRSIPRNAGMLTAGLGRKAAKLPLEPELWFWFDYASGNRGPDAGSYATFNQLYPLGHKYFGYMDIVGRQNILDPNVYLRLWFGRRMNVVLWYHNFHLASARAPLFNAAGVPTRADPTGTAGRYVGDELDIAITYALNPNADLQLGVSQFWSGPFVQRTAPNPAAAEGGNFLYSVFTLRF